MKRADFADSTEKLSDPLTFQITNIRHNDEKYENIDIDNEDEDQDGSGDEGETRVNDSDKRYKIQLFGVTKGGHTVHVNICDFTPYFFVEVPDDFTETKAKKFVRFVKTMLEIPNCRTCGHTFSETERWCKTCNKSRGWFFKGNLLKNSCKLLEKEKMVGFTNHKKFKFIRLVFNNHTVMRKCSWMFNKAIAIEGLTNGPQKFVCHESNIEPIMRWLHIQKIEPAGWVTIKNFVELQPDYSTCNFTLRASFMDVKPSTTEGLAPIMCAAFDIECTSKDGGFPKANRIEDACIMVCTTFRKYPDTESCYKVCHTLKESKPIEGCEIIYCESERDLLIKWRNLMQTMDPDFIYGYNSNGFDFKYMYDRAVLRRCEDTWLEMSRCVYETSKFELKKLSSSALGDNVHKFVDMKGRIVMDVMKEIQKEHKLDSFKLDAVAEHFTGDHKEDLSPKELFANYHKGTKKLIREIATYCFKDTELCHDLAFKLAIIVKAMKMANVCTVPTEYIFYRGQGVKIFSLMSKECRKRGMIMPVIKRPYNDNTPEEERDLYKKQEQFQGALVIETDGGLYYDPIVVLDFNSLYPSCQIGWNMSHDTLVIDEKYNNIPGLKYETVKYSNYDGKEENCTFVQNEGEQNKGLVPSVVGHLLTTRKAVKRKLKTVTDPVERMLLDCEQLAYKIVANSIFGQTGASTSQIYLKHIAACTTSKGREMLYMAKDVAEKKFSNVETVYGDSVAENTPILIRNPLTNIVTIKDIQDISNEWFGYPGFKSDENDLYEKQQSQSHYEVWSDKGWTSIRRVIRHKTNKKMFNVKTNMGSVTVTEDHSLLLPDLTQVKPTELKVNIKLLHALPPKDMNFIPGNNVTANNFINAYFNNRISTNDDDSSINTIEECPHENNKFVYDLETDCGRFQAGVGFMIVKNTDSNFYKIKGLEYLEDPKQSLEEIRIAKLKVAIQIGHLMSDEINEAIGKPGVINFEYEKTFFPFLIVTKKRYYGILYEEDPTHGVPKVMGLAIKRRNYCKYTKEIMQGLLDKLMANVQINTEDIEGFIKEKLKALIDEKVEYAELVITNTLRDNYKNPGSIAHRCLADRMIQRGETVNLNDRIPFVYAMHKPIYNTRATPVKQKIANIVEHPKYAQENGIKYDPEIYITGQIREPVSQILGFVIEDPKKLFDEAIQECRENKHKIYGPPVKAPMKKRTPKVPDGKKSAGKKPAIVVKLPDISDSEEE